MSSEPKKKAQVDLEVFRAFRDWMEESRRAGTLSGETSDRADDVERADELFMLATRAQDALTRGEKGLARSNIDALCRSAEAILRKAQTRLAETRSDYEEATSRAEEAHEKLSLSNEGEERELEGRGATLRETTSQYHEDQAERAAPLGPALDELDHRITEDDEEEYEP